LGDENRYEHQQSKHEKELGEGAVYEQEQAKERSQLMQEEQVNPYEQHEQVLEEV
jgi:hypothetical protein